MKTPKLRVSRGKAFRLEGEYPTKHDAGMAAKGQGPCEIVKNTEGDFALYVLVKPKS